jgi:hypothetical protein
MSKAAGLINIVHGGESRWPRAQRHAAASMHEMGEKGRGRNMHRLIFWYVFILCGRFSMYLTMHLKNKQIFSCHE